MIPSGYKEDTVFSAIPTDGSGDLSFTRASNGTRVNSAGLVEVCPWNLVQQSETLSVSPWGTADVTITDNSQTAPNGTSTADVLTEGTGTAQHRIYQTTSFSSGIYTVSAYVKNITGTRQAYIDLGPFTAFFTFSTETIYSASGVASFEKLANGWYRISLTSANPITPSTIYVGLGQGNTETYTGNGTSAIAFWGIQYNIGSTAKPYFPTTDRSNVPRLTYQNGGGGCPSLLLEKQSTNVLRNSEDFSQSTWAKLRTSITANAITSPDGTQNADKAIANTDNSDHSVFDNTITSTSPATLSIYAKAGEYNYIFLGYDNGSASQGAFFNLSNGTISQNTSTLTASIQSVGNGWYRCVVSSGTSNWSTIYSIIALSENGTSFIFAGDGSKGIYIWGAQAEQSSYATSYIPTTSASATRVADACFKTGISSLIGQTEGVMFIDYNYDAKPDVNGNLPMVIYDGSNEAYIFITGGGNLRLELYNGGVLQCLLTTSIGAVGRKKIAFAYKQNDFVGYMNGVQVATDTSGTVGSMSNLYVGSYYTANYNANGGINQALLFKTRLSNSDLIALTTI
jgi:hypothetical protein